MLKREDITRERIDHFAAIARAQSAAEGPPMVFWSHEQREHNRQEWLARHHDGGDLWVFGYGSLIWNPALHFAERRIGRVFGFHRRFCMWLTLGRGSVECPGLMLALDRGGSCVGMAYRIAPAQIETETDILWMREMLAGTYEPRACQIQIGGKPVNALTFVAARDHVRYAGRIAHETCVRHLANAEGHVGTCRDYLEFTVKALRDLEIHDGHVESLWRDVYSVLGASGSDTS